MDNIERPVAVTYDWVLDKDPDTGNTVIYSWALNKKSESVLTVIQNFPVQCYIELPRNLEWGENNLNLIRKYITFLCTDRDTENIRIKSIAFTEKFPLYYYRGEKKTPFLRLFFNNTDDLWNLRKKIKKGPTKIYGLGNITLHIWEAEISTIRKFLSFKDCEFGQWYQLNKYKIPESKISTCKHEYICDYNDFSAVPTETSENWRLNPSILAFDIETYSPNHKAMPNSNCEDHVVYMISCIYQKLNMPETLKRYALVFGECNDIQGSEIMRFQDEISLIRGFEKLIIDTDPDIITGYNIMGYDYPYLDVRLGRKLEEWNSCGRLINSPSKMNIEKFKNSGYGFSETYDLKMPGRINIDLLPLVRKDFKLEMFKLDYVANYFLGKSKHDIKADEMFRIYESKNVSDLTRLMVYCIRDSSLVIDLFEKLDYWIDSIQKSSILGVNIVDIFTRGQQVKCVSQIYHECFKNNIVLDKQDVGTFEFEGGFVGEPVKGLHENIICLDFASMYPSIIRAHNISYETLVAPEYNIPDSDCHVYSIDSKEVIDSPEDDDEHGTQEIKHKIYNFKFVKQSVRLGILPKIVKKLVDDRKAVRSRQKTTKDPFIWNTLEKRQLAIKVACNSIYGFLAAYALPLMQGAMATTWTGRQLITTVNDYLLKHYPECRIIYNDTDSVMVDMRITDSKMCDSIGNKLAGEITSLFPDPVKLEYEKSMRILNLMKKKYAYFKINKDGTFDSEINRKGILTARRDNCQWMREMYDSALISVLKKEKIENTFSIVFSALSRLENNKVNPEDLCIVRSLGANYKSENYFMKVFADELRRKNKPVNPGDRLKYLLLYLPEEEHQGKKMILLEDFIENPQIIDHKHYISLIGSHIEQLFSVSFPDHFSKLNHVKYKPNGRKNPLELTKFIEIYQYLENKEELKKYLFDPPCKIAV